MHRCKKRGQVILAASGNQRTEKVTKEREGTLFKVCSRSSAGALIGDIVTELKLTMKSKLSQMLVFEEREYPEKTSRCRVENQG